jgi:hypothetical protein
MFEHLTIVLNALSVPLFEKEGLGEIFLINPPQSPFFKGGGSS